MHEVHELIDTKDPSEQVPAQEVPPDTILNCSRDNFFKFFIIIGLIVRYQRYVFILENPYLWNNYNNFLIQLNFLSEYGGYLIFGSPQVAFSRMAF